MKKQELQQKFNEMAISLKGLIKDELIAFLEPMTHNDVDYQYLRKIYKQLESDFNDLIKARKLVPETLWDNYEKLNIKNLPEQKIFGTAKKNFTHKLKEIFGGKKQLETASF